MTDILNCVMKLNMFRFDLSFLKDKFRSSVKKDCLPDTKNPVYDLLGSREEIEQEVKQNQKIMDILKKHNLPLKINEEEFEALKDGHLKATEQIATKIYRELPESIRKNCSLKDLQDAAVLHDFGKILIPADILNKKGSLNFEEKEIMRLHSEIGYELLKNKNVNQNVLNMVKYHHQNKKKSGYPFIKNNNDYHAGTEVLSIADKYSALTEKRSYKKAFDRINAFSIISQEVNNGLISQSVFTALAKAV